MSAIIQDPEGNDVTVLLNYSGGMVDTLLRAEREADWFSGAFYYDLLSADEDGNVTAAPGVDIDYIGAVVLTPAVLDDEGNEVTPAVVDNRLHINLRISGAALAKVDENGYPKWQTMALNWVREGDVAVPNNQEVGKSFYGVTQIDPDTIRIPKRVWL